MAPWQLDPTHSTIPFSVRHLMVSNVRGSFRDFGLEVEVELELTQAAPVEAATPVLASAGVA